MSEPAAMTFSEELHEECVLAAYEALDIAKTAFHNSGPEAWNAEAYAQHQRQLARYRREIQGLVDELIAGSERLASEIVADAQESIGFHQSQLDPDGYRSTIILEGLEKMLPVITFMEDMIDEIS